MGGQLASLLEFRPVIGPLVLLTTDKFKIWYVTGSGNFSGGLRHV